MRLCTKGNVTPMSTDGPSRQPARTDGPRTSDLLEVTFVSPEHDRHFAGVCSVDYPPSHDGMVVVANRVSLPEWEGTPGFCGWRVEAVAQTASGPELRDSGTVRIWETGSDGMSLKFLVERDHYPRS